jgi:hypothetical protein
VLSLTIANYPRLVGATTVQFVAASSATDTYHVVVAHCRACVRQCGRGVRAGALRRSAHALQCAFNVADDVVLVVRDRVIDIAVHDLLYNVPPSLVACLELHFAGALKFESSCIVRRVMRTSLVAISMIDRVPVELKRGSIATRFAAARWRARSCRAFHWHADGVPQVGRRSGVCGALARSSRGGARPLA